MCLDFVEGLCCTAAHSKRVAKQLHCSPSALQPVRNTEVLREHLSRGHSSAGQRRGAGGRHWLGNGVAKFLYPCMCAYVMYFWSIIYLGMLWHINVKHLSCVHEQFQYLYVLTHMQIHIDKVLKLQWLQKAMLTGKEFLEDWKLCWESFKSYRCSCM